MTLIPEKLWPLHHEVGHSMVAEELGYGGHIELNTNNPHLWSFHQKYKSNHEKGLEDQLIIDFAGLGAEKLLEIPKNDMHAEDIKIAFEHLKELYSLQGKNFEYENYLEFPKADHCCYLAQSYSVLNRLGGAETISKQVGGILKSSLKFLSNH